MDGIKRRWGVGQWAAFFENQPLPVMRQSKILMSGLEVAEGDSLSPRDLSDIVLQDPLLCLRLLRAAEQRKSHRLDHETTTALAAILQLGVDRSGQLVRTSPEIRESPGLVRVGSRARLAAQLARTWSVGRGDVNPDEVAVAALLAGTGDLLLWVHAPEIPQQADEVLRSGQAQRSAEAQLLVCGFTFKELTLQCAERWRLPALVIQLLRGSESLRARLTRVCSNAARHILDESDTATLALANDLVEVSQLIPEASVNWLVDGIHELPEERRPALIMLTQELRSQ